MAVESKRKPITADEAEKAFAGLIEVGQRCGQRVHQAVLAGDISAEAVAMSMGMAELQDYFATENACLMAVMRGAGRKWGFRTDRDEPGGGTKYDVAAVIDCVCQSLLLQLKLFGNEWNIISSQHYITQEGWTGKLRRLPGVSRLDCSIGVVDQVEKRTVQTQGGKEKIKITATIGGSAGCLCYGELIEVQAIKAPSLDGRLQLRATADHVDEAIDQLKGKAAARLWERLYGKCLGIAGELLKNDPLPAVTAAGKTPLAITNEPEKSIQPLEMLPQEWTDYWKSCKCVQAINYARLIYSDKPNRERRVESALKHPEITEHEKKSLKLYADWLNKHETAAAT